MSSATTLRYTVRLRLRRPRHLPAPVRRQHQPRRGRQSGRPARGDREHGITILCSIPTAFNQILFQHPDSPEEYDVFSLRVGMSAGEP
ncbi:long-chain fatty acid--CoA ligase [Halostagnicola sp. A56]|uniref:long-chain fatty acid--CoA ligase n=1 Tax=Halostagnicola sp. A56 TaxID=1495067 RepID=UPI00049FB42F|nr:long-chain fatty acid--CoA ligase [Halostagnicola sp. A56]